MPVLYSPLISSTPSTPMANCAKKIPDSDVEIADCARLQTAGLIRGDAPRSGHRDRS